MYTTATHTGILRSSTSSGVPHAVLPKRNGAGAEARQMPRTLAAALELHQNRITALRLLLALLVLVSHSYLLGGFDPDPVYVLSGGRLALGTLAVVGFFFVSGVLITRSFLHSASVWRYLWHRALRILPGYWVCLFVGAYLIGTLAFCVEHGFSAQYLRRDV